MDETVTRFFEIAKSYCGWAEGPAGEPSTEATTALRLVSELYRGALDLPDLFAQADEPKISDEDYQRVFRRFASLPFNYYSQVFNPLSVPPEEPVVGDLADDLADIWRDIRPGVLLCNSGKTNAAVWVWRLHFGIHWGRHAAAALYALHAWLSNLAAEPAGTKSTPE